MPPTARPPQGKSVSKEQSEAVFLQEQAANAKAAFKQTLNEVTHGLANGVDPRAWTAEHPWVAVATAAAAGFAAASFLIPSKEEQALKRLAAFERALGLRQDGKSYRTTPENGADTSPTGKPEKKGFLPSIASELIRSMGPALASALTAGAAAHGATGNATTNAPEASNTPDSTTGSAS